MYVLGGGTMTATTVTNFRKNVFEYVSNTIRFNDPVQVTTKEGTAVLLSEEDYNGLLASVEIMSVPGMAERIIAIATLAPVILSVISQSPFQRLTRFRRIRNVARSVRDSFGKQSFSRR